MRIFRLLFSATFVMVAAVAGNLIGSRLYALGNNEPGAAMSLLHRRPDGEIMIAVSPRLSNLVPTLLLALLGKPRWIVALLGGIVIEGLMGDRYQKDLQGLLLGPKNGGQAGF